MTAHTSGSTWALRAHAACDWVLWTLVMNVLWVVFTLAGGIVLGAAPAAVAATALTRRRLRGEKFAVVRSFASAWRTDFVRANVVSGPPMLATTLLVLQAWAASATGTLGTPLGVITAGAGVVTFLLAALVTVMFAHYDLPLRSYVVTASRWMLRNLAHALLLLVAAVGVVTASLIVPGLIPFVSVGGWLTISTALCLAFFTANDRLVEAQQTTSGDTAAQPAYANRPQLT